MNYLTDDTDFTVKESKRMNMIIGIVLLLLSVIVLYHIFSDYHSDQASVYLKLLGLTLIPAVFFMIKGSQRKLLFRINKTGIYRYNELLTDWNHFVSARVTQEVITGSFTDNFILLVEFYRENETGAFVRKMKLPNTMDKSEEEIVETIRYFSKCSGHNGFLSTENNEG